MRYIVALAIAALFIAIVIAYGISLQSAVIAELRAEVQKLPDKDQFPEAWLEQLNQGRFPSDWASELPDSILWKIGVLNLLYKFWPIWASFIAVACVLAARCFSSTDVPPAN